MHRRTVLAAVGSALFTTAGCVSSLSGDGSGDQPSGNKSVDDTPTDDTHTVSDPDAGDGAGTAFGDCPSFADSADQTICAHTGTDASLYPTVSQDVFSPTTDDDTVETLAITLHNESDHLFGFNPYEWAIKRETADGWEHVAPGEYIEPLYNLEPGDTYSWELSVESRPSPDDERTIAVTEELESGRYAFQVTGTLKGSLEDGGDEDTRIECVALFDVSRS